MTSNWYYAAENRQMGPIPESELDSLVASGIIKPQTLVWKEGMEGWRSYSAARSQAPPSLGNGVPGVTGLCSQCQRAELQSEMIRFGPDWVCADCKELYTQRLREGTLGKGMVYAGFWTRVGSYLIDTIILGVVQFFIQLAFIRTGSFNAVDLMVIAPQLMMLYAINFAIQAGYYSLTVYYFGGSPGKLALGCRIVTADGENLTLMRSLARYFASLLSFFTIGIGHIMAAFDDERRTMHDRICDTRVILKSGRFV